MGRAQDFLFKLPKISKSKLKPFPYLEAGGVGCITTQNPSVLQGKTDPSCCKGILHDYFALASLHMLPPAV